MAEDELEKLAEKGDVQAQLQLASRYVTMCYMFTAFSGGNPNEMIENYYCQAAYWFRRAAEQGNSDGQFNLAECYYYGKGVKKDFKEAFYWFKKAACGGVVAAQTRLGDCYGFGYGVEQNDNSSYSWYKLASENGDARAQCCLAICYLDEVGIKRDVKKAVNLLREAFANGDEKTKEVARNILTDLGFN